MNRMTIGKVSKQTGCNIETIRYYEKEGLLTVTTRSEGGHRLYANSHVERISFIRRCRELGFSMVEIRQLLSLVDGEKVTCASVKEIADTHLQDVVEKIRDLRTIQKTLRTLVNQCSGKQVPECPIISDLQR